MSDKRIPELDVLRGLAIFGVVVIHSCFEGRFTKETMAVQAIMSKIFDWSVLAFFFSSGFLHDRSVPFAVAVKKRCVSLLAPFFLYNALYNICFAVLEPVGWVHHVSFEMNFNLLATGFFRSPAFQLYFLPYLFLISTVVCCVDKLIHPYGERAYLLLLASVLAFYLVRGYPEFSYGADYSRVPLYLAAFLVGARIRPILEKRLNHAWMFAGALVVVLSILALSRLPFLSLAVPPLLVGLAGAIPRVVNSRALVSLGALSGSIYLWHTPIMLPAITKLLAHCGIPSVINLFGSIGLTLAACILIRLGLDSFFKQVLNTRTPRYITL